MEKIPTYADWCAAINRRLDVYLAVSPGDLSESGKNHLNALFVLQYNTSFASNAQEFCQLNFSKEDMDLVRIYAPAQMRSISRIANLEQTAIEKAILGA